MNKVPRNLGNQGKQQHIQSVLLLVVRMNESFCNEESKYRECGAPDVMQEQLECYDLIAYAEKRFRNTGWGIRFGIRFDTKGMTTDASTKNYHMEMSTPDGSKIVGSWYGNVKTHVENIYLSVPLLATYSIGERWTLSAGAYASCLLHGVFDGEAYDGYIRDQNPTGEKTEVSSAGYDFSSDIRKFQWGLQGGAEYVVYKHLAVFANLQWGLNGIFPSDYSCVTFPLYPIYGTLGFSYLF